MVEEHDRQIYSKDKLPKCIRDIWCTHYLLVISLLFVVTASNCDDEPYRIQVACYYSFIYGRVEVVFNVKGCIGERARRREAHEYESTAAPDDFAGRCDARPGKSTKVVSRSSRISKPLSNTH